MDDPIYTATADVTAAEALNGIMAFEHPIQVHADGTVTDAPRGIYAPDVYHYEDAPGYAIPDNVLTGKPRWELLNGYSMQDHYSGPIMHASESIGGQLARDILAAPGIYVAVVVNVLPDDEDDDPEPAGWAVAKLDAAD